MILNFNKLCTSKLNEPNNDVLDKVHVSVTMIMNELLLAPYTVEEVQKRLVLHQSHESVRIRWLAHNVYKRISSMFGNIIINEELLALNIMIP